jgi:hypothetical protein
MAKDDERTLQDIRAEESTRGRRQPKRALSLAKERWIRRLAAMVADPSCDRETFLEVIREFGLTEQSDEYRQVLALWRKRHGNV